MRGSTLSARCAAVCTIARVLQEGQIPLALQENARKNFLLHPSQWAHAKPLAKIPHSRYFWNAFVDIVWNRFFKIFALSVPREIVLFDNLEERSFFWSSSRRIGSIEELTHEIKAWEKERNEAKVKCNWQFRTEDARIKLKKLYPSI
jgi:hypothetical protein